MSLVTNQASGMIKLACTLVLLGLQLSTAQTAFGQVNSDRTAPPANQAGTNQSTEVALPLYRGGVNSKALFDAISGEMHWIAGSVTAFTQIFGAEASGPGAFLPQESVDELVRTYPDSFSYRDDLNGKHQELIVNVKGVSKRMAEKKSALREFLAGAQGRKLATLEKVESTWGSSGSEAPRIVVVMAGLHGVDSSAEDVALQLHERTNLPMAVFSYPNDGPILDSSKLLTQHLKEFRRQHARSQLTLVTHSMGGLVSRGALELQPHTATQTGVDQLIQICPPNYGSALAEYGPLLEGAEQAYRLVSRRRSGRRDRVLFQAIVDGFNEASADLNPKSEFLTTLNSKPRNPNVRYSILAGNDAPLRGTMSNLVSSIWSRVAESINEPAELNRRIRNVLGCEELQKGKGDGVVKISSARLPDVDDFEVMPMHHLVWSELDTSEGKKMLDAVASRLGISL